MRLRTIIFTRLLFLLLVMVVGTTSVWAQTTYHLQKVTSVEGGGLYVFEQSGHVMGNTISSNVLKTITSYKTVALTGTESYVWTLEAVTDGFKMKNVSLSSKAYLTNTSSTNVSFDTKTNGTTWTFTFQDDQTVLIQKEDKKNSDNNRFLGYNENYLGYKAYDTFTYLSTIPHAIVVYRLVENPTTVTVTVGTKGFATLACDYALDFTGKSIKAYTITSTDGSSLTLTQKDLVAKDEPVLLYSATASDSQDIPVIAQATADTNNKLVKGTGASITWSDTEKVYILYTGGETPGFYRANNSPIATNKAYLDLTTLNANARSFTLSFDEETTGVADVRGKMSEVRGEVFDLQGRRVAQPSKGLYIMNGKMVIIK